MPGAALAKAEAKPKADFTKTEQILRWINDYRHQPEPDRLPAAVKAMFALGLLKDVDPPQDLFSFAIKLTTQAFLVP